MFQRTTRVDFGRPGEPGKSITRLYTTFEVTKDDSSAPNTAKCSIFNLNEDSAALLREDGVVIQIFSGYEDTETDLVFLGDVTRAYTTTSEAEAQTFIESGDGSASLSSAVASVSIKGDTTVENIITNAVKDLISNPAQLLDGLSNDTKKEVVKGGYSASGPVKNILKGLSRTRRFDWMYLNGELKIVDRDAALKLPAVVVSPETGLIGSPSRLKSKGKKGVQFRVLLNGKIVPRRIIKLEAASYQGYYLVRRVIHRGDSGFGADNYTQVEATEIKI